MSVSPCDMSQVKALVESELGMRLSDFRLNEVQGTQAQAYWGRTENGREIFVKVGDPMFLDLNRAVSESCRGLAFIPAVLDQGQLEIDGRRIQVSEYKRGEQIVDPCLLTDCQFKAWVRGYVAFSERIQRLRGRVSGYRIAGFARPYRDALRAHVSKSRLAQFLLADILRLAARAAEIDSRLNAVIHGDFTFYNYSFSKEGLAAVYDFDALTLGMPCEDLLFAFTSRFRDSSLHRGERSKLLGMLTEMISMTPWPKEDWRAAIDLQRLREAAWLIEDYPNPVFYALKASRRDRRHAIMLQALNKES